MSLTRSAALNSLENFTKYMWDKRDTYTYPDYVLQEVFNFNLDYSKFGQNDEIYLRRKWIQISRKIRQWEIRNTRYYLRSVVPSLAEKIFLIW